MTQDSVRSSGATTAPRLIEVRRRRGGAELRYAIGDDIASALVEAGRVVYPHPLHVEGESRGPEVDAAILREARADVARAELAALVGGRP